MKNLPYRNNSKNSAFTLIELLIVVAILGALASMVMLTFRGSQASARDARRQSDLKQYQNALEVYANRSNSLYPVQSGGANISTAMCGTLNLSTCPDDPLAANPYRYQSDAGGTAYVLWARLERPNASGNPEFFILCSNGNAGKSETAPTSSACPL